MTVAELTAPGGTAGVYRGHVTTETAFSDSARAVMSGWKQAIDPVLQGAIDFETTIATINPAKAIGAGMVVFPVHGPLGGIKPIPFDYSVFVPRLFPLPTPKTIVFPWKDLASAIARELNLLDEPEPDAFRAFKEIGEWLGVGDEAVAEAVGIGRTTPYAWQREGREPRRGTARRVYEFHAVLNSLRRELGPERLAAWLLGGEPARRDALLAGDLESIQPAVDTLLFANAGHTDLAWAGEDTGPVGSTDHEEAPRASRRRPRRARLG